MPSLFLCTTKSIVDYKDQLLGTIEEGWNDGVAVIALPNTTLGELRLSTLRKDIKTLADAHNLDLDIIFPSKEEGGQEIDRWELGWTDGHQIFAFFLTKEHFEAAGSMETFLKRICKYRF